MWTKNGHNPRHSHATFEAAQAEAMRLADKHPKTKFFVLEAKERIYVPEL